MQRLLHESRREVFGNQATISMGEKRFSVRTTLIDDFLMSTGPLQNVDYLRGPSFMFNGKKRGIQGWS